MERNRRTSNQDEESSGWSIAAVVGGVLGGAAALGTAIYLANKNNKTDRELKTTMKSDQQSTSTSSIGSSISSFLSDTFNNIDLNRDQRSYNIIHESGVRSVPDTAVVNNLNSLLSDIYIRYTALRFDDFQHHYDIFQKIFYDLHNKMKLVDPYYNRYSGMVQFAGSHYDRLRIKKPDEFDMDIVIGLPLNIKTDLLDAMKSDIVFEPTDAGFLQLRLGVQGQNLPDKSDWEINRTAYKWKDDKNYLLRSKFTDWFKGVVARALNLFDVNMFKQPIYKINGVEYTIGRTESGPAVTLIIRNNWTNFKMDVDLVPALRFPESRWPITKDYKAIPSTCKKDFWMVVPKPNKNTPCSIGQSRSWRIALHYQERELMYNSFNLRQAIKLIKKFRDAQNMHKIASYYIKTVAYWEILERNDHSFWTNSPAVIFTALIKRFHDSIVAGNIPYMWNKKNNLLHGINRCVLDGYAVKIKRLMNFLAVPSEYKKVAELLLTKDEFYVYNTTILNR